MSPDPKKPCLHCQLWAVLKKRLPKKGDKHVLASDDAIEAAASVAEFLGELLAAIDPAERQFAFDGIMQAVTVAHETTRQNNEPNLKPADVHANAWLL